MKNPAQLLAQCSLFRGISVPEIESEILPHGSIRQIPRGSMMIQPQEKLDYFGVILKGSIHTMHVFSDGGISIMDVLEPTEVFGADLMCTKSRISPYHALAAEEVQMLYFPVRVVLEPGPIPEPIRRKILDHLLVLLAQSNMKKEYRLAILSRKGLRDRIMTYLSMQAAKRHTDTFEIPFTREELASFLCVNRSALSHELSMMRDEGILSFRKNRFTLHREDK